MRPDQRQNRRLLRYICIIGLYTVLWPVNGQAIPAFARQYNMSCVVCHVAVPRLNSFGEQFADMNMRLPHWKQVATVDTGDDRLALLKTVPLAVRASAYIQGRSGEEIDITDGSTTANSRADFQAPYMIKLLSGAPLSDHITYYFYALFAEKGNNGEALVEDAWFAYSDILGSGIDGVLGQFQIADLMFRRETRLTFQDFQIYRMAQITYDRGVILSRGIGKVDLSLGFVNGNGITENFNINSPGFRRPDQLFDNDTEKTFFGRIGVDLGVMQVGVFGLLGEQKSVTGFAGTDTGSRDTDKRVWGLDVSGSWQGKVYWFGQFLWNEWDGFLDAAPNQKMDWFGGFAWVDYVPNDRWAFSLLWNVATAHDFAGTNTVFEGIDVNSLTGAVSYYFMRNVRGILEANYDFLTKDDRTGPPFVAI
jgi:hypothetical protein